jgi:hypothetical protein
MEELLASSANVPVLVLDLQHEIVPAELVDRIAGLK